MTQLPIFQSRDAADPAFWDECFTHEYALWGAAGVPTVFRQFCEAQPAPLSTLIPGCGNAYEVGQLVEHGWSATTIDFAPNAVASARAVLGPYADVMRLVDFFHFSLSRPVHWIYERASLCAMPRRLWPDYAAQVAKSLPPRELFVGFFTVVEGRETMPKGPPFETTQPELDALLLPASGRISDMPIAETDPIPVFAGRECWQAWRCRADRFVYLAGVDAKRHESWSTKSLLASVAGRRPRIWQAG